MASKYYGNEGAQEILFIARSEQALPSYEDIENEIQKYIPDQDKRNWFYEIKYSINRAGNCSYKISLYYELQGGNLYGIILFACIIIGCVFAIFTGNSFLDKLVGCFIFGSIGSGIGYLISKFVSPTYKDAKYRGEKVCSDIELGLKEMERRI